MICAVKLRNNSRIKHLGCKFQINWSVVLHKFNVCRIS